MTHEPIYLTFLNNLGGFEYFLFRAKKEHGVDILESGQTRKNIFPSWPNSYGSTADTIDKQTYRVSKDYILIRSQYLTANQRDALKRIKSSPLVQIVASRTDRTTVLVDQDSFKVYDEQDDTFTIAFKINFTNDVPSQRV